MKRVTTSIIQKCQQGDKEFSKVWFTRLITENTDQVEFDRFCREIMLLNEYYDTTCGLIATDHSHIGSVFPDITWRLEEIDFDRPITFRKIK